jgi:LacI family transcriptional regulator
VKNKRNVLLVLGWYDPRIIEGVGRYAREAGWHLEMRTVIEGTLPSRWRGDGMLVNDTTVPRLERFIQAQIGLQPTVLIGSNHRYSRMPAVHEDNAEVGRLAARHFLERGHQNFAWLGLAQGTVELGRRNSFRETLREAGRSCQVLEWRREVSPRKDTWEHRRNWLAKQLEVIPKPLALFCLDDLVALDALDVCLDLGWRVPEDVAVMGVGNMELACECARIPISSVDENLSEISYRAAEMLQSIMEGGTLGAAALAETGEVSEERGMVVPVKGLFSRRSTESLAVTHRGVKKALEFMNAEYAKPLGLSDIARAAGVSQRALQYAFQGELRRTPIQQLLRIRLARARELLVGSEHKVGAVAELCGFGTVRHLHRCFVKEHVCSPQGYRARVRGG